MLPFLQGSQLYALEKALEICERHHLIREQVSKHSDSSISRRSACLPLLIIEALLGQVFVLGRMGNSQEALVLILEELLDVKQAIDFVHSQRDPGLRDELMRRAFGT